MSTSDVRVHSPFHPFADLVASYGDDEEPESPSSSTARKEGPSPVSIMEEILPARGFVPSPALESGRLSLPKHILKNATLTRADLVARRAMEQRAIRAEAREARLAQSRTPYSPPQPPKETLDLLAEESADGAAAAAAPERAATEQAPLAIGFNDRSWADAGNHFFQRINQDIMRTLVNDFALAHYRQGGTSFDGVIEGNHSIFVQKGIHFDAEEKRMSREAQQRARARTEPGDPVVVDEEIQYHYTLDVLSREGEIVKRCHCLVFHHPVKNTFRMGSLSYHFQGELFISPLRNLFAQKEQERRRAERGGSETSAKGRRLF